MDRTIGMILEMTAVALLVAFLLFFLFHGSVNGGSGIWSAMGTVEIGEEQAASYEVEALTEEILAAPNYEVSCVPGKVYLNREYDLMTLFIKDAADDCYLELEDVSLCDESVLAKGEISSLFEEESPAAALYDEEDRTLVFTKTGNYVVRLKVGNEYGWKPTRTVFVAVPAVSASNYAEGEEGGV